MIFQKTIPLTRVKLTAIILIGIAAIMIPVAASYYYQTSQAVSQANATGPLFISWGDPDLTPQTSQGTGWESLTITGIVSQLPNLPGYYRYKTISLEGKLHAQWMDNSGFFVLDSNFSLSSYETLYQETTLNPSTDSFYVSFMDYSASIQVNGTVTSTSGEAGIKAAVPGYFEQRGQSRITTFIIYAPSLGDPQFVIQWSQTSQTLDGTRLPAATQFSQTINITGYS